MDYRIGTLWIGERLSFIEQLCLKSFVDAGQDITLYTYGPVDNVPDGVTIGDANTILATDSVIRHTRTGSPAPQADRFRYHMLAQKDRVIWADTDAYCVRPFTTKTGHFHGWESPHHVNNGVLGLPKDSDTLRELIEFTSDEYAIPEWLTSAEQDRLKVARDAGHPVGVGDQQWGAWGPKALTHFLHKTGEIRFSQPIEALYPISFKNRAALVKPGRGAERFITPETFSVHFYGRRMRNRIADEGGVPDETSLIGRLLTKHGIRPADAPLPPGKVQAGPLPAGARAGRGVANLTDLADKHGSDQGSLRHRFTELYQMLFHPMRERALTIALVGLDGGGGVGAPDQWPSFATRTLGMWREYFPNARFLGLDRPQTLPAPTDRVDYRSVSFDDVSAIAAACDVTPDIIIDDATHASHHQQNALRALFPKLAPGGLYVVEDLRTQPAPLEKQNLVKTAALFQGYLETGVFELEDDAAEKDLNAFRVDISGCFVFQAKFQKHRRDQMLVLHKR